MTTLNTSFYTQKGPTCMVAAARMVISGFEIPPSQNDLSRSIPIWPDGIYAFDLAQELEKRGWSVLIFAGPPEAIARLIEAGYSAIAMIKSVQGRHSVAVTGAERLSNPKNQTQCSSALYRLLVNDPNESKAKWITAREFEASESDQQAIVIFKPDDYVKLSANGFPIEIAKKVDRRFRAQTLSMRWTVCHKAFPISSG